MRWYIEKSERAKSAVRAGTLAPGLRYIQEDVEVTVTRRTSPPNRAGKLDHYLPALPRTLIV